MNQRKCKHRLLLEGWSSDTNILVCAHCSKKFDLNQIPDNFSTRKNYDNANMIDILMTQEDAKEMCSRGCFTQSCLDNAMFKADEIFKKSECIRPRIKYREILVFCLFQQLCKEKSIQNPKTLCNYFNVSIRKLWMIHKHVMGFEESHVEIADFIHTYCSLLEIPYRHTEKICTISHKFPKCGSVTFATLAACLIIVYCQVKREELLPKTFSISKVSKVSTLSESNLRKKIGQYKILNIVKDRLMEK